MSEFDPTSNIDRNSLAKTISLGIPSDVFPRSDATQASEKADSKQIIDQFESMAKGQYVTPKYDPNIWAQVPSINTRLGRCIRTYVKNIVGLGWYIEPIPLQPYARNSQITAGTKTVLDAAVPNDVKSKAAAQTEKLRKLFNNPNPKLSFPALMGRVIQDRETTGNGYLEIVRNIKGEITKLYHAPSISMRIRRQKDQSNSERIEGFIQIRGNKKRYFKEFGDSRVMDAVSGEYVPSTSLERTATEILHFSLYSTEATYYGVPRYISAAPAISGNRLAGQWNVTFFANDAVPRMAVLVSGGRIDNKTIETLEDFWKTKAQGVENAHRVVVIQTEVTRSGFAKEQGSKIELRPLGMGRSEDASFLRYREANDEEVRESFGIANIFFRSDNVNKSSAFASKEATESGEFEPERLDLEYSLNNMLVKDILGEEPLVYLRFERLQTTDPSEKAKIDQTYSKIGVLTINEIRDTLGKPRFPKEYVFADKPLDIALAELRAGVALLIQKQGQEGAMQLMQLQERMKHGKTPEPREKPSGTKPPADKTGPKLATDAIRHNNLVSLKSDDDMADGENLSKNNVDNQIQNILTLTQTIADNAMKWFMADTVGMETPGKPLDVVDEGEKAESG